MFLVEEIYYLMERFITHTYLIPNVITCGHLAVPQTVTSKHLCKSSGLYFYISSMWNIALDCSFSQCKQDGVWMHDMTSEG